jgi:hypothetical protein
MPLLWVPKSLARHLAVGGLVLLALAGCSPEATRTRGGGPGADVGNHEPGLPDIHAGAQPAYDTPLVGRASGK